MGWNKTLVGQGVTYREPPVGYWLYQKPYKILKKIGEGGFGTVFLGKDTRTFKRVAIKHLHVQDEEGMKERFEREAAVMALVKHPGVIAFRDSFYNPTYGHFLVMEYIDGECLDDIILQYRDAGERLDLPFILHVMERLLEIVAFVHAKGIIHRDLKAQNVYVVERRDEMPEVKLGDFGIAKVLAEAKDDPKLHKRLTARILDLKKFYLIGSPESMAPEQIQGMAQSKITPATDVYALGVLLYYMLTGEPPFVADPFVNQAILNILEKHLQQPAPDARDIRRDAPEALALAVQKAMAKKREDRYQSAEEFLEVIRAVRAESEPAAAPVSEMPSPSMDAESEQEPMHVIDALATTMPIAESDVPVSSDLQADSAAETVVVRALAAPTDTERSYALRKRLAVLVAVVAMLVITGILWFSYIRP